MKVIKGTAAGAGEIIDLDLGSVIDPNAIAWNTQGVTVTLKSGTTYSFNVPKNVSTTWNTTSLGTGGYTTTPSKEDDPDAIPSFGAEHKITGTIKDKLQVEITQSKADALDFEYYGRFGTLLTDSEKLEPKNKGYTRKRAVIQTIETPPANGPWGPANDYCTAMEGGWYLPGVSHLSGVWIAHNALPPFVHEKFWTSLSTEDRAWYVDLTRGFTSYFSKDYDCYVRCTKDL